MDATRKGNHSEVSAGFGSMVASVAESAHDAVDRAASVANSAGRLASEHAVRLALNHKASI